MKKLLIALLSLTAAACTEMTEEERRAFKCTNEVDHNIALKAHIKARLRSPSTADFASYSQTQFNHEPECRMLIRGYVDSQNGFGATIRTHYTGITRYDAASKSFIVEATDL